MTRNYKPKSAKLSDNPSSKRFLWLAQHAETIRSLIEFLHGQGVEHEVLNHLRLGTQYMQDNKDYVEVADRFNRTFADKGWIATESLRGDILREALALHDEERYEEAEDVIIGWFNPWTIQILAIGRFGYFGGNESRKDQLNEALELTQEERYRSAIPLILIACEGFAKDVLNVNLYSQGADLTAFDSVVGHSTALPTLVRALTKSTKETSEETTDVPGRHGIVHGRTLGYATKSNCMKAWLLCIALTDLHIERLNREDEANGVSIPIELELKDAALVLLEKGKREALLRD